MSTDHNPKLLAWRDARPAPDAGKGVIFEPGSEPNLRWQNRSRLPTPRERRLADATVQIYAEGLRTPAEFADRLNVLMPEIAWTEAVVQAEFERLAN